MLKYLKQKGGRRETGAGNSRKGISLPLVTGLVTVLMIGAVSASDLIIRALRSVRSVESSAKAYFVAEGGLEDALYELAPHYPGYETPRLEEVDARLTRFGEESARWEGKWSIESRPKEPDSNGRYAYEGKLYKNQKMTVYLFADNTPGSEVDPNGIATLEGSVENVMLNPYGTNPTITFWMPKEVMDVAFPAGKLNAYPWFDSDMDGKFEANEDEAGGLPGSCVNSQGIANPEDNDCDGRIDEDNNKTPAILWKLLDDQGRSLIPLRGCVEESAFGDEKSEICEKSFTWNEGSGLFQVKIDGNTVGQNQDGARESIADFMSVKDPNWMWIDKSKMKLQFEFVVLVPMEFMTAAQEGNKKFSFPYFEYKVEAETNTPPPFPQFVVKSDGYFSTFKQSITATITPKTTVPLYDFTIIQQK